MPESGRGRYGLREVFDVTQAALRGCRRGARVVVVVGDTSQVRACACAVGSPNDHRTVPADRDYGGGGGDARHARVRMRRICIRGLWVCD